MCHPAKAGREAMKKAATMGVCENSEENCNAAIGFYFEYFSRRDTS